MSSLMDGPDEDPRAAAVPDKSAALRAAMDAAGRMQNVFAADIDAPPPEGPRDLPRALDAPPLRGARAVETRRHIPARDAAPRTPTDGDVIARLGVALGRAPTPPQAAPTPPRREPSIAAAAMPDSGAPKPTARPEPTAPRAQTGSAPTAKPHADHARPATPPQTTRPRRGALEPRSPRRAFRAAFGAGLSGLGARSMPPRAAAKRRDPSPSVWRYRLDRLSRRTSVQFALRRLSVPLAVLAAGAWLWNQQAVWIWGDRQIVELREAIAARPEFAVTGLAISGGSPRLRTLAHEEIALKAPASSLSLDLDALRKRIEALPGIASARLTIGPDGLLRAALTERAPVALWRWEGQLHLVDREGVVIGPIAGRADRPALPLIIGAGADRAVPEALALHARAAPLRDRLRALVRVGERRWTLALDRDQVIMLPAKGAEAALARVLALDSAEDLLAREVTVIDMRLPQRPTLRMTDRAVVELLRLRAAVAGEDA